MATSAVTHREYRNDRMDASEALLCVSSSLRERKHEIVTGSADPLASVNDHEPRNRIVKTPGCGLDALAMLASRMTPGTIIPTSGSSSSSDEDDSEAMPPPPPRRRSRSCSNPEGMEKWDSLSRQQERMHFVLPSSIIEEELAEAKAAADRKAEEDELKRTAMARPTNKKLGQAPFGSPPLRRLGKDDAETSAEEMLKRARSRLLEDLSEGSLNGEKGVLTLPHSLSKYKDVYNKNGRIGIYTPSERAAIIARFNSKRSRRVWNKKIRYNCRKNLADRRMRVKGRFVKRSTEAMARSSVAQVVKSPPCDEDMPDVNDPEAGFAPTPEQPYRRLRRHTIT